MQLLSKYFYEKRIPQFIQKICTGEPLMEKRLTEALESPPTENWRTLSSMLGFDSTQQAIWKLMRPMKVDEFRHIWDLVES